MAGPAVAAVIPARGGSKRIPRKNLRPFLGVPVISRVISSARASGVFDVVFVSTEDEEIGALAKREGAEIIQRPASLADDKAGLLPVMAHAVEAADLKIDDLTCCIYATAALLDPESLRRGLASLDPARPHAIALAVVPAPHPIERAMRRSDDGSLALVHPNHALTRTQDLPEAWFDAGQFAWGTVAAWMRPEPVLERGIGVPVDPWTSVDLDTNADWTRAEALASSLGFWGRPHVNGPNQP